MKRKLLSTSLWGLLTLSLFYSCRTDSVTAEQSQQATEKIAAFERFEKQNNIIQPTANSNQGTIKYVSYAQPFAEVIYNFLENHPDYAEKLYKEVGDIRLDVSSQTIGELSKTVIFPVLDGNGNVVSLWRGVINENRDYVKFYHLNNNSEYINSIKKVFQNYYNQKKGKLANIAIASTKGISPTAIKAKEPKVTTIDEVIITVPKRPNTNSGLDPFPKDPDMGTGGGDGNGNSGDGMSGGPGTHGGSNGGNGPSTSANKDIINNLKDFPCAQKLLEQLPNLNNSLAKILNDALATNAKINVTFEGGILKAEKPGEVIAGRTDYVGTNSDTGVTSYKITLNQDILRSATQEYILAVMYHESIHAFLGYQFKTLGADAYHEKYPYIESYIVAGERKFRFIKGDHQAYGPFVNQMANAIQSFNPKFPRDRAISLAMEGITEDDLPNNGDSYNTLERYSGDKAVGTKCAKP